MALTLHLALAQSQLQTGLLHQDTGLQPAALRGPRPGKARHSEAEGVVRNLVAGWRSSAKQLWRTHRRWRRRVHARLLVDGNGSDVLPVRRPGTSKPAAPKRRKPRRVVRPNAKRSAWQEFLVDFLKQSPCSGPVQARQRMQAAALLWSSSKPRSQDQSPTQELRSRPRPTRTAEETEALLKLRQESMARARKLRWAARGAAPSGTEQGQDHQAAAAAGA